MTALALVCTGRKTHPETTAVVEEVHPAEWPDDWPPPSMSVAEAVEAAMRAPRRKQQRLADVYRCPYVYPSGRPCRCERRVGAGRIGELNAIEAEFAGSPAALLGWQATIDISFM